MRNITAIMGLPFEVPPISDITDLLPKHISKVYPMRKPEEIDSIIIHHMASEAPLRNQALYHVNGRDWARIGYHLVIDTDKLLQVNDLLSLSNHCAGWNHRAIGISIRGDLSKRAMTDIERKLLYVAILTVKSLFAIKNTLGHNEASKLAQRPGTSCPCTDVNTIRREAELLEEQINYLQSPDADTALIVALQSRIKDLESKLEPNHQFYVPALYKAQLFTNILDAQGFSQQNLNAFQRINSLYQTFLKPGEFQPEARRKLLIISHEAKKQGLIA